MQDLTNHVKKFTNASAVYIGKLVTPKQPISDVDDDRAHIDENAEKIIHFSHADSDHDYLVDKTLKKSEGLTFDVFVDKEESKDQEEV